MVLKRSSRSYLDTTGALTQAIERRGLTVFARIDHAAAAREVGLELAEEEVVLFGNPRGGTPLMQSDRRVGIELPLRMLIWREGEDVLLAYRDPRELGGSYDLASQQATLEQMAVLLEGLAGEAASS
jgi:uncharacterized protein (DUF302 family)